jgi:hypothetical protein
LGLTLCCAACGASSSDDTGSGSGEDTTGPSDTGELPDCAEGQSRFTASFTLTDLSADAPTEGEPFEELLESALDVLACVDRSEDINADPLRVDFESTGTIAFFGPGSDHLTAEIVSSFASVSRIDWQVHYQAPDEPQILNFNVWGDDVLPRWLLHVSCSEFEGPGFNGGEVQLAPINCDLSGGRLTRSDADGSYWAEGLGSFQLDP